MSKRKLILSMQITLDGYIAGLNDEADWLIAVILSGQISLMTLIQLISIYSEEKCILFIQNTGNRY